MKTKELAQSLGLFINNGILLSHFPFIVNQAYRLNDPIILNSKFMSELTARHVIREDSYLMTSSQSDMNDELYDDSDMNDELYEEEVKKNQKLKTEKAFHYSKKRKHHSSTKNKRKKQMTNKNSSPSINVTIPSTTQLISFLYDSSQSKIIGFEYNGQEIYEGESIYLLPHEDLFPNHIRGKMDLKSYPYLIYRVEFKEKSIYGRRLYRHYDMAFLCMESEKNILTTDVHQLFIDRSSETIIIEVCIEEYCCV